jgi:hypothetical protein
MERCNTTSSNREIVGIFPTLLVANGSLCVRSAAGNLCWGIPFADAASDLVSGRQIQLYSRCHGRNWIATRIEVEQLREYFLSTLSVVEPESLPQPVPAKDPPGRMPGSATL